MPTQMVAKYTMKKTIQAPCSRTPNHRTSDMTVAPARAMPTSAGGRGRGGGGGAEREVPRGFTRCVWVRQRACALALFPVHSPQSGGGARSACGRAMRVV